MDNSQIFSGKWALILGGSSGFGMATIKKLAQNGMNIVSLYREMSKGDKSTKSKYQELSKNHKVSILPYNLNALDEEKMTEFVKEIKEIEDNQIRFDVILHSIARGNLKPLVNKEANEENWLSKEDIEGTTYAMGTSLLFWVRSLYKNGLIEQKAKILALISEGVDKYWETYAAVAIAKTTLLSLAKYMAVEFGKLGFTTNLIQAGITQTPSFEMIKDSEKLATFAANRNPLGRLTQPEDIANVIYLLCQPESNWINGSVIYVDGGEHCL